MPITLTAAQHAWIDTHIARGDFTSVEQAVRQLIDERISERAAQDRGFGSAWAKHGLEETLADAASRRIMVLGAHEARIGAVLASIKI